MTENSEIGEFELKPLPAVVHTPALWRFIINWGELGTAWGINRSVAQIHAVLFVSDRALSAEDIADALQIARSNVSASLKTLIGWGLVRRVPRFGDRRDYFIAESDVFEMARKIAAIRKAREFDPVTELLDACLRAARSEARASPDAIKRLSDLREFVSMLNKWYDEASALPKPQLLALLGLGAKAVEFMRPFLEGKGKREEGKGSA